MKCFECEGNLKEEIICYTHEQYSASNILVLKCDKCQEFAIPANSSREIERQFVEQGKTYRNWKRKV